MDNNQNILFRLNSIFLLFFIFLGALFPFSGSAAEFVRGINYDPVHSVSFAHGTGTDDEQLMKQAIFDDLDKLKAASIQYGFKITHLKTFFSKYQSLNNRVSVNMADVVHEWNQMNPDAPLILSLGVYQFRPGVDGCANERECEVWTQGQMEAAKIALAKYNASQVPLIDSIIIGNENLDTPRIEWRLVKDIREIKQFMKDNKVSDVKVGTAQMTHSVMSMYNGNQYKEVLDAADFIGVNIYPFWGGVFYGIDGTNAKASFAREWQKVKKTRMWGTKPIYETEEGWPSARDPKASVAAQHDYFYYWYHGHPDNNETLPAGIDKIVPVSYFFALNDKLPGQGVESHWGLFSADNHSSVFDSLDSGRKNMADNIVFPVFLNYIGADADNKIHDAKDIRPVLVVACTEDNGKGVCYPLYGFFGSGRVPGSSSGSWSTIVPGRNAELMIDTSLRYYKSLMVILDDGKNYPGICTLGSEALQKLKNGTNISIRWPVNGIPGPCF